jgi:hypothetical protein
VWYGPLSVQPKLLLPVDPIIIQLGARLEPRRVYVVVSPWTACFTDVRRKHTAAPLSFFFTGEISPKSEIKKLSDFNPRQ